MCPGLGWLAIILIVPGIIGIFLCLIGFVILVLRVNKVLKRPVATRPQALREFGTFDPGAWAKLVDAVTNLAKGAAWLAVGLFGVGLILLGIWVNAGCPSRLSSVPTELRAAWVELGPHGAVVRAVAAGGCPDLVLAARSVPMQVRSQPAVPRYPDFVCEAPISPDVAPASVAGVSLPRPHREVRRVVIIGDTGCRLSARAEMYQACDDPREWPFRDVAALAAAANPDLVIHVGDIFYREDACPAGKKCVGTPWAYNWTALNADFFEPAKPLLLAAPWVFVRGNHEDCNRGGAAWFRFFAALPSGRSCPEFVKPYLILTGDTGSKKRLLLLVFDSSGARPKRIGNDAEYRAEFEKLNDLAVGPAWLLIHNPIWAWGPNDLTAGEVQPFSGYGTLQAAWRGLNLSNNIALVISGDIHLFEVLGFAGRRPPQIVAGNGGTCLDRLPTSSARRPQTAVRSGGNCFDRSAVSMPLKNLTFGGVRVDPIRVRRQFGYVLLEELSPGRWQVTLHPVSIDTLACIVEVGSRRLRC